MSFVNLYQYIVAAIIFCALYVGFTIVKWFLKLYAINHAVGKLPSDPRHWFWGHMDKFPGVGEDGLVYFYDMVCKYPRVFGFWVSSFSVPSVVVHHPDTIKGLLKLTGPKPVSNGFYGFGKDWMGDGLAFSDGEKWHRNRRLLTNLFHFEALKYYITVQNEATELFLNKLSKLSESKKSFEISSLIMPLTFDIFLRCAFSFESDAQKIGKDYFYIQIVEELTRLWNRRIFRPWEHFDFIYKFSKDGKRFKCLADQAHVISEKFIKDRKKALEKNSTINGKYDFLDILLKAKDENGLGLTDAEIRDEVDTFLVAGYETTSSALMWVFYSLACHPEHQKLCQEEIDSILRGRPNELLEWKDLQNLPYLTMCIKESFRLHGSPVMILRELRYPMVIDGVELPPKTQVMINIYNLHHNPTVWNEPMKFDPQRFAPNNIEQLDPFAYLPFSAGPRNCIGQAFALEEMKVIIAKSLRRFTFELDPERKVEKLMALVMKTTDGLHFKVTKRN